MQSEIVERWKVLCALAAVEQDSTKLLKFVTEINNLLMTKEERLIKARLPPNPVTRTNELQ